jgi:hypothetical protein
MPNTDHLVAAFRAYFQAKAERQTLLNDTQAGWALKVLQYLQNISKESDDSTPLLSVKDLSTALTVLANITRRKDAEQIRKQESYVALAKELYREILESLENTVSVDETKEKKRITTGKTEDQPTIPSVTTAKEQDFITKVATKELPEETAPPSDVATVEERNRARARENLIAVLAASGDVKQARDLIARRSPLVGNERREWQHIIRGFKLLKDGSELRATAKTIRAISPLLEQSLKGAFVVAYAQIGEMNDLKYSLDLSEIAQISPNALLLVVTACLKYNEIDLGRSIVRAITENGSLQRERALWDSVFLWALGTGKGVDEVNRMMEVMGRTNKTFQPNNKTIHTLIKYANSQNNPYLAERIVDLGRTWKISPDAKTYLLQMDYRLSVGDIEGARTSYQQVQMHDVEADEDFPRVNRLIQAMCDTNRYSFDTIMTIVEDLNGRNSRFPPATVAALATLHLIREEYHDVVDLLKTHVPHFSIDDRAVVRDVLLNVCLDPKSSLARVWDTYMIYQAIFPEVTRETRTNIMQEFFLRERCDMAVHVFNHMREHPWEGTQPTTDTYATALVGVGKLHDDESLEVVHNALKLDMNIEPSTKLYNALMLGYVGCEMPRRALAFWGEILSSREGPSYESLLIVFKVTEEAPFGERKALQVWKQLRDLDVEITRDLVAAYLGALQGNYLYEEARKFVLECEETLGIKPDAVM